MEIFEFVFHAVPVLSSFFAITAEKSPLLTVLLMMRIEPLLRKRVYRAVLYRWPSLATFSHNLTAFGRPQSKECRK